MRLSLAFLVALSLGCGSTTTEQTSVTITPDPELPGDDAWASAHSDATADVVDEPGELDVWAGDEASPAEASAHPDVGAPVDAGDELGPVRCQLLDGAVAVCGMGSAAQITWPTGTCSVDPYRNGDCPPGTRCCVVDLNNPPSDCDFGTCL